jgi:TatD-related deoxyribonuclease
LLYSDAHLHVNPIRGLGAGRIARKFKSTGGWFLSIISLPPHYYGFVEPSIESYRKVLDLLIREASRAKGARGYSSCFYGFSPRGGRLLL